MLAAFSINTINYASDIIAFYCVRGSVQWVFGLWPMGYDKSGLISTNIYVNPKDLLTTMTGEMKNVFNLNLLFICCVKTTLV